MIQAARSPDHRKSAGFVAGGAGGVETAVPVTAYAPVRQALRESGSHQAGFKAELITRRGNPVRPPILQAPAPGGARCRLSGCSELQFLKPAQLPHELLLSFEQKHQRGADCDDQNAVR